MDAMEGVWTISELAELAGTALADDPVRVNGRVRELPNERLIRWYTTIGLVDPPLARRGRTALYGPRHLLQLVAVKRRQAAGLAIARIQAELTGATDDMLRDIARLPETVQADARDAAADASAATPSTSVRKPRPRDRFWAAAPSAPTAPAAPATPVAAPAPVPAAAGVVTGIRLAAGLTLLLDAVPRRPIADADLTAIAAAARPLLDELRRRGLHPEQAGSTSDSDSQSTEPDPPTSPGRRSP
jgi:DNA-binding transcriptional MerR regulator